MANKDWTGDQKAAIMTNGNVLVSAAAGSGKTAVLVERVIKKLTDSTSAIPADKLLIVTFTNAAAAEMRTRIEKRLNEEIRNNPTDMGLVRQKHLLNTANICTIDSFCINLIRQNFDKLNINPDFKIADEATLDIINNAVARDIAMRLIAENNEDFNTLADIVGCEYDEKKFITLLIDIHKNSTQLANPEKWYKSICTEYESGKFDEESFWYNYAFKNAAETFKTDLSVIENAYKQAKDSAEAVENYDEFCKNTKQIMEKLLNAAENRDWNEMRECLIGFEKALKSKSIPKSTDGVLKELANHFDKDIVRFAKIFYDTSENISLQYKKLSKPVKLLSDILIEFENAVFNAYNAANMFTFYNAERLALRLLTEYPDIADAYYEVMVDEYQDVNDLQEQLFTVLSHNESTLFAVGDIKQSVYGFRGANPKNFAAKKERYIPLENAKENDSKKIVLSNNFRSRKGICEYVNYLFGLFMHKDLGGIEYNAGEQLFPAAKFPENGAVDTEIHIINKSEGDEKQILSEAQYIADYIKRTVNAAPFLKETETTLRKARYGDFAILLRKDGQAERKKNFANVLRENGIPVLLNDGEFKKSTEIMTALALLKVVNNPYCDIELLTVMLSQIFNFTPEKVAQIRAENKKVPLYSSVISAAEKGDEASKNMLEALSDLRLSAVTLTVSEFLSKMLNDTNYLRTVTALENGTKRRDNLMRLIGIAADYEATYSGDINGFINYVNTNDFAVNDKVNSDANAVKIITIHHSKGLQFPICIVADLSSKTGSESNSEAVKHSINYGIGFKYFDEEQKEILKTPAFMGIRDANRFTSFAEEMRNFYVACTRAEERLVLINYFTDYEKKIKSAQALLKFVKGDNAENILPHTDNYADWIITSSLLHKCGHEIRGNGSNIIPFEHDSEFKLFVDYCESPQETVSEKAHEAAADESVVKEISQILEYRYPFEDLGKIKAKVSVSQIANKAEFNKFSFSEIPAVTAAEGITATERGTATHKVMQFFDFSATDVKAEIDRLTEWEYITERQAKAVNTAQIERFLQSDVLARIKNAQSVHREMRFLTEIPAGSADDTLPKSVADKSVMLQGAIDLCFEEDDGIVVLDFKTDRVQNAADLREAYSDQITLYADVCAKMFKKPVKQCILYSFELSEEILI